MMIKEDYISLQRSILSDTHIVSLNINKYENN